MPLMARDRSEWSRCFLWHCWLPGLCVAGESDPWTASLAVSREVFGAASGGAFQADDSCFWTPPDLGDAEDLAIEIGDHPCVWTDGSKEECPIGGFEVAHGGCISGADVVAWPKKCQSALQILCFWGSLHWLAGVGNMGHFGCSYLEILILFEQWAGHSFVP